jgi:hypothetical protein
MGRVVVADERRDGKLCRLTEHEQDAPYGRDGRRELAALQAAQGRLRRPGA